MGEGFGPYAWAPSAADVAERQLQRIMARAMAMLAQHAPPQVTPSARRVLLLLAILVAGLLMGSALLAATRLVSEGSSW